ncbi:MAG: type II secretion system protein [Fibrobacteraceae bacterium]|nr:type II secretion system protein [Fibrobacteraceae bacterium]
MFLKKGFTLIELLVYIAIVGVVVLVAGQAFSDSTKFRVRSQSMLKAAEISNNAALLIKEDFAQMGAKSTVSSTAENESDEISLDRRAYIDNCLNGSDLSCETSIELDSSSYKFNGEKNSDGTYSDITFRKIRYDEDGSHVGVEEVRWFLDGETLKRQCKTIESVKTPGEECPEDGAETVITDNVTNFKIIAAKPGVSGDENAQVFPAMGNEFRLIPRFGGGNYQALYVTPEFGGTSVQMKGLATNYDFDEVHGGKIKTDGVYANQVFVGSKVLSIPSSDNWGNCASVTIEKDREYELSFRMSLNKDASRMFVPNRDHMAIGFRKKASPDNPLEDIPDFLFYPPAGDRGSVARKMNFTSKVGYDPSNEVCIAFVFSTYSPLAANGTIAIDELVLKKVEYANYKFEESYAHTTHDKKNVKAFQIQLQIKQNGESGESLITIPTPSNGTLD